MKHTSLFSKHLVVGFVFIGSNLLAGIAYAVEPAGLGVTQITAVKTFASADNTFENGWKWVFDVTVPSNETILKMKFADWTNGAGTIPAGSNIRFFSSQFSNASNAERAITLGGSNTYSDPANINIGTDLDVVRAGRQIQIVVETRVPVGSAGGSYGTSYGINSVTDAIAPLITLTGDASVTLEAGSVYTDAGATALDNFDGDSTSKIVTVNPVNTSVLGTYTITYNVSDTGGNVATEVKRTVMVVDTSAQATAETAVLAYENAPLSTLAEVTSAEALEAPATNATALVLTTSARESLTGRITARRNALTLARTTLETTAIGTALAEKRASLSSAISSAQALHDSAVVGTQHGQYPEASRNDFADVLGDVTNVRNNPTAVQADIEGAIMDLQTAVIAFEATKVEEIVPTLLTYTISDTVISPNGDGVKDTVSIDVKFSEKVKAEINILNAQGEKVQNIYTTRGGFVINPREDKRWDGKDTSGTVVAGGTYTIQVIGTDEVGNKMTDITKKIEVVNTLALSTLIISARSLHDLAVVGVNPGQYKESAKNILNDIIEDAKNIVENANVQGEVDDLLKELGDAIEEFNAGKVQ